MGLPGRLFIEQYIWKKVRQQGSIRTVSLAFTQGEARKHVHVVSTGVPPNPCANASGEVWEGSRHAANSCAVFRHRGLADGTPGLGYHFSRAPGASLQCRNAQFIRPDMREDLRQTHC